jgi:hypothetical protein
MKMSRREWAWRRCLRDHANSDEIDETDQRRGDTLMCNRFGHHDGKADRAAKPVIDRGAEQLAPCHRAGVDGRKQLHVPGAVADFADDGQRRVARPPHDDDRVV